MSRYTLLLIVILILLLGTLGYVLYPVIGPTPDAPAWHSPHQIPNTDVHPLGANFFLEREVEDWKREETVRMASEAGIRWVKQQFIWTEIEPQQGQFRWSKYDAIVDLCESYGLQIIARLDNAPDWSRQDNTMPGRPPDNLEDYGEFVYQFVSRYRGRIQHIQIWNEPNLYIEWGNRPVDPAGYVEMLRIAYTRAKEADPNVYVLSAPLAITLGEPHPEAGKWRAMNDLQFLEEMYQAGGAPYFDILSANAFGMDLPPDDPAAPDKLNVMRVVLQRAIMEKYHDERKAVWFNEYAWNVAPASFAKEELIWQRVTEEEQAAYTLQGIEQAMADWPWAGVFNIWYFRQVGDIPPDDVRYYFRMVDVDFVPRRIYFAVKDKAAQLEEAGPGYFEETSPAVYAPPKAWRRQIDRQASGESVLVADQAGSNLSFTFSGSGISLIAWTHPLGGQLLVTIDGKNVPGLPLDSKGRSFIELYAAQSGPVTIPIIRDTSTRRQTLRLVVSEFRSPDSGGEQCIIDAFQVNARSTTPFPILPVLFLLAGCTIVGAMLGRATMRARTPE